MLVRRSKSDSWLVLNIHFHARIRYWIHNPVVTDRLKSSKMLHSLMLHLLVSCGFVHLKGASNLPIAVAVSRTHQL
jgi:hypothetical protein